MLNSAEELDTRLFMVMQKSVSGIKHYYLQILNKNFHGISTYILLPQSPENLVMIFIEDLFLKKNWRRKSFFVY